VLSQVGAAHLLTRKNNVGRLFSMRGPIDVPGFDTSQFVGDDGDRRTYYVSGSGPPVMVLHELPGMTDDFLKFAERLRNQGFTVYCPLLFGSPGHSVRSIEALVNGARTCLSAEFAVFARRRSSPVADALRALGRLMNELHGGPGIAVVGLCLTGNFALAMMADEYLVAPVLCEPALPLLAPASLHLTESELSCVKRRVACGARVLGFRFKGDILSPAQRFRTLSKALGPGFDGHELEPPRWFAHAVFTTDYSHDANTDTRRAFDFLVAFLRERLNNPQVDVREIESD
jgi:dienelactone hydrolase